MAAALNTLTEALDEPGTDIAHSLHQLTLDAAAAVPTYLGLSVVVAQGDPPITLTTLADGVVTGDIRTSLRVLLPGIGDGDAPAPVALILYAGAPGTFVDLAAELAWLIGQPLTDITLDQHLTLPAAPDTTDRLQAASDINQAIGVLIGRGDTPRQARWQLDNLAADNGTDRHTAAHLVLDTVTPSDECSEKD
ncbi:hypothetical protein [Nocardia sp. NPDC051570]|uniref:hypothetical protein n=1 Tax=Nocardia sp. NPDC051570 TaxID=3364324 RepID=UPI0037AA8782